MIDVVIPNWNGREMLKTCLDSLANQTFKKFRIIVVDNGSTDGSVEYISSNYPEVRIVSLPDNRGFSYAVNQGILNTSGEWIFLLNNDVEVDSDCLTVVAKACVEDHNFDFFALKMINFHDRTMLDGAGDAVLRGGVGYRLGTLEKDNARYGVRREVFGACAGAAVYRKSLFAHIGMFDKDFFAYLEDVDFNLRAARFGSRCRFLPDAKVFHIGSATSGSKINSFTVELSTRNNICVILKNYDLKMFFRFLPAIVVYQLAWLLLVLKKGQFMAYCRGLIKSIGIVKKMAARGKLIKTEGKLSSKELASRIIAAERQAVESIMERRLQQGKDNALLKLYLRIFC